MKDNKGVTLIALIITLLVMTIIIGISVTGGSDVLQKSKATEYIGIMKLVKARADVKLEEEMFSSEVSSEYSTINGEIKTKIDNKGYNNYIVDKWTIDDIASEGIDNSVLNEGSATTTEDDEYFVVIFDEEEMETVDVLYSAGCSINSARYYSMLEMEAAINGKVNVKNLIRDGGFENKEWTTNGSTVRYDTTIKRSGNYSLRLEGNSAGNEITSRYNKDYKLNENHKYYISAFVKDTNTAYNKLGFYYQYGEPSTELFKTNFTKNGWDKYSSIFNITQYVHDLYIRIDNDNMGGNRTVYFDEWHLVDLTATLDFNTEPVKSWTDVQLKAWCDKNLEYGVTQAPIPEN